MVGRPCCRRGVPLKDGEDLTPVSALLRKLLNTSLHSTGFHLLSVEWSACSQNFPWVLVCACIIVCESECEWECVSVSGWVCVCEVRDEVGSEPSSEWVQAHFPKNNSKNLWIVGYLSGTGHCCCLLSPKALSRHSFFFLRAPQSFS